MLTSRCEAEWHARRQCEAMSVTGRPCLLPYGHDRTTGAEREGGTDGSLQRLHKTGFLVTVSSASGAVQREVREGK